MHKWFFIIAAVISVSTISVCRADDWEVLQGCHLIPNESNDGDSFHVDYEGEEYIFRLYFVDTPETDSRFPDRVLEQACYFGITSAETELLGQDAGRFTEQVLKEPFTVYTRWHRALGSSSLPRYYAIVQTHTGDVLSDRLVEQGLARIHGTKVEFQCSIDARCNQLSRLEEKAREEGRGGWVGSGESYAGMEKGEELSFVLSRTINVFSYDETRKLAGVVSPGALVTVDMSQDGALILTTFRLGNGETREWYCNRYDLSQAGLSSSMASHTVH